jgi:hypothetical protein
MMQSPRQILFEHIPKTGGVTLRGILQKVYGANKLFLIESRSIGTSLRKFAGMTDSERFAYNVITGHGADMFRHLTQNPFRITILREPVRLFISQYNYLKISPLSVYYNQMQNIKSIEAYMDFAVENGQDNLLTRFLSNSCHWLVDETKEIPDMTQHGEALLKTAKENLLTYDAVIDLGNFDAGIYALNRKLHWKHGIPIYKPSNRTITKKSAEPITTATAKRLEQLLRFDAALYEFFMDKKLDIALQTKPDDFRLKTFLLRQQLIKRVALLLGKN